MIVWLCSGLIVGMLIGKLFREPVEKCPRVVLKYDCKGLLCDHRKSELYKAMASMAQNDEERSNKNYWNGGL